MLNATTLETAKFNLPSDLLRAPLAGPEEEKFVVSTRAYELMIIVDGDHDDATVDQIVTEVDTWVQGENGTLVKTDKWGKRRFAYEINHKTEGHYVVLEITTGQVNMEPLERSLRLSDEVVRHKLIRLPDQEAQRRGLI